MDPKKYYSIVMHATAQQFREGKRVNDGQQGSIHPEWLGLPRDIDMEQEIPIWTWVNNHSVWLAVFTAEHEYGSMARHFRGCGWKSDKVAKLRNFAWFSAKVDMYCIPLDGVEISPIKGDPELVQTSRAHGSTTLWLATTCARLRKPARQRTDAPAATLVCKP